MKTLLKNLLINPPGVLVKCPVPLVRQVRKSERERERDRDTCGWAKCPGVLIDPHTRERERERALRRLFGITVSPFFRYKTMSPPCSRDN